MKKVRASIVMVPVVLASCAMAQDAERAPRIRTNPPRAMSIFEDCEREGRKAARDETLPDGKLTDAGQKLYDAAYRSCLETRGYRGTEGDRTPSEGSK